MIESDLAQSRGDVMREIADLKREIREMRAERRLAAATIVNGAVQVLDGAGDERLRLGKLADSSFGLEVVDPTAGRVKLAALAFGAIADADAASGTRTGTAPFDFGDLAGASAGPSISATIGSSGRALVNLSALANMTVDDDGGNAFVAVSITGATTLTAAIAGFGHQTNVGATANIRVTVGRHALIEGLNPGVHTFKMVYAAWTFTGLVAQTVTFQSRDLAVLPY